MGQGKNSVVCASPLGVNVAFLQSADGLPTSQTCFFQIRLPTYSSQTILTERLRYAITHCRSIDMDNYMLTDRSDNDDYDSEDYYS